MELAAGCRAPSFGIKGWHYGGTALSFLRPSTQRSRCPTLSPGQPLDRGKSAAPEESRG